MNREKLTKSGEQPQGKTIQPGCWILIIFGTIAICLLAFELSLDVALFLVGDGSAVAETGVIPLATPPETDEEFVITAILALRKIGWWQDEPYLVILTRKLGCSDASTPSHHRSLLFEKGDRITLLSTNYYQAILDFNEEGTEVHYRLEDFGVEFNGSRAKDRHLMLDELNLTSDDALRLAEQSGGEILRESIADECRIFIYLFARGDWEVDYLESGSGEGLMCFDIDPFTGEIKQVASRGYKPCEYQVSEQPP